MFLYRNLRVSTNVTVYNRAGNDRLESIPNRFSRANRIEFPSSSIFLVVCKAGASSACMLATKLPLIALHYKFEHFTNIIIHILLYNYVTF